MHTQMYLRRYLSQELNLGKLKWNEPQFGSPTTIFYIHPPPRCDNLQRPDDRHWWAPPIPFPDISLRDQSSGTSFLLPLKELLGADSCLVCNYGPTLWHDTNDNCQKGKYGPHVMAVIGYVSFGCGRQATDLHLHVIVWHFCHTTIFIRALMLSSQSTYLY
jgi:hypothetical protein